MWRNEIALNGQGSQLFDDMAGQPNICATQEESRVQNEQIAPVGYFSDTEEIFNASWSLFEHDCGDAFKLSERSPLPPPLSAKDLSGG